MGKNKSSNNYGVFLIIFWALFALLVATVFGVFFLIKSGAIGYLPPIEDLKNPKNKNATEVYSADMKLLGNYFYGKENRIDVNYSEISPYMINALIATEDARYLSHSGIDGRALVRSVVKRGIFQQKSAGGGSTITQQLAKQLYSRPTQNFFQRLLQKPNEWVIAVELERLYTKDEIIAMYLNKFDFLNNAVGIKSAAKVYFDTTPADLKIEEAATLVGMCKNPSYYNPVRRPERTEARRNVVLDQMCKGDYITQEQCDSLKQIPLQLKYQKVDHKFGLATYFREYLRQVLMAKEPNRRNYASWQYQKYHEDSLQWKNNPLYGWCNKNKKANGDYYNIYVDGLKIYTTIDSRMQKYAEEAVAENLKTQQKTFFAQKKGKSYAPYSKDLSEEQVRDLLERAKKQSGRYSNMKSVGCTAEEIDKAFETPIPMTVFSWDSPTLTKDTVLSPMDSIRYQKHFLRCGFMSMDAHTGYVKAYVGGADYRFFQYDMVTSGKRQVGSTIKPFLYTLAMEEGMSPCDLVPNVAQTLVLEDGRTWTPRTDANCRVGEMVTIRWGLSRSSNWITAYLMKQFTPEALVRLMRSFGIRSQLDPVVSLALGPAEISVEEMVGAYSTFANKGLRVTPMYVTRIEDNNGNVLATFLPEVNEVVSEETSYKMVNMLRGVIDEPAVKAKNDMGGTGGRVRWMYGIKGEVGGKTGTTQNSSDCWFMGFTPELVSGVWIGGEERSIHFDGRAGQGAWLALPVWGIYMQKVLADPDLGYTTTSSFGLPEKYQGNHICDKPQETVTEEFGDF
ncbi:MAG: transglycosylase domain-containing protein [Paludibacteraceae bacterium]|nr:transglycosylase domain-containing protein [Paludibacteraceae bacterium]MDD6356680.1 transglycosylase domain-containing protein [Bacteroidales bacterium]